jgi:hypothetical protein
MTVAQYKIFPQTSAHGIEVDVEFFEAGAVVAANNKVEL